MIALLPEAMELPSHATRFYLLDILPNYQCFNCGFLFQCHSTEHTTKDCPNEYSELDAEGKPREQYTPAEISVDEMFNNNIQSGLNFGNFEKVALQVSLTCYYVPSIFC